MHIITSVSWFIVTPHKYNRHTIASTNLISAHHQIKVHNDILWENHVTLVTSKFPAAFFEPNESTKEPQEANQKNMSTKC